jgi:hypothetical protein
MTHWTSAGKSVAENVFFGRVLKINLTCVSGLTDNTLQEVTSDLESRQDRTFSLSFQVNMKEFRREKVDLYDRFIQLY